MNVSIAKLESQKIASISVTLTIIKENDIVFCYVF